MESNMTDNWKMHGPFETNIIVHVTDGENTAMVTWVKSGLMAGADNYQEALNDAVRAVRRSQGDQWRLMSKREYFDGVISEKMGAAGMKLALPGGKEWSPSALKLANGEQHD
jgi:hypothetical protein